MNRKLRCRETACLIAMVFWCTGFMSRAAAQIKDGTSNTLLIGETRTVSVTALPTIVEERHANRATFTFTRTGNSAQPLTVSYTIGGTATKGRLIGEAGADYILAPDASLPSITIPGTKTSATVEMTVIIDGRTEGDETVVLTVAAGSQYAVGALASATVTIREPPLPNVSLQVANAEGSESGPTPAIFTVSRTGGTEQVLVVHYQINPPSTPSSGDVISTSEGSPTAVFGTDFNLIAGSNPIPPGVSTGSISIPSGAASAPLTVMPIDDSTVEPVESVTIQLLPKPFYIARANTRASVRIQDNDASVEIFGSDATARETGPDKAAFKVTRSGSLVRSLSVPYKVSGVATNGQDYQLLSGTLTIPAGQASALIEVIPIPDKQIEEAETVIVALPPSPSYVLGPNKTATARISD